MYVITASDFLAFFLDRATDSLFNLQAIYLWMQYGGLTHFFRVINNFVHLHEDFCVC